MSDDSKAPAPWAFERAPREWFGDGHPVLCLAHVSQGVSMSRGQAIISVGHGDGGATSLTHWELSQCFDAKAYMPRDRGERAEFMAKAALEKLEALEIACQAILTAPDEDAEKAMIEALRELLNPPEPEDD